MTKTKPDETALADEMAVNQLYVIRGQKVMLDRDLAALYWVNTRRLRGTVAAEYDTFS